MQLRPDRIEISGDVAGTTPFTTGSSRIGPMEIEVAPDGGWSITNTGDVAVAVRAVDLVFGLDGVAAPLRMWRNGYQSWSPCGVATFGIDRDPSTVRGSIEMVRGMHHADAAVVTAGELRSEWVTVLQGIDAAPVLVGFDGGDRHDGTLRLRDGVDGPELWVEAFLGGAVLAPGEQRVLHRLMIAGGSDTTDASSLLEEWASVVGEVGQARISAPFQVGWCSWYHYFHDVTEDDLRANLAAADDWPFEVFQLDDGFQSAIGDWLTTNERFPSGLGAIAEAIAARGRIPGLWLAPFLVAPDSEVATAHPAWLARDAAGEPLFGMFNPPWGGGMGGFMWTLDTTHPEVLAHLETLAGTLVGLGFGYLKLDFTFAPAFEGQWHDPSRTPAERVRAGYDAVRRGAGEATFILGCGVPLANVVGVVDGARIGADVAPSWAFDGSHGRLPGYDRALPATVHAWQNTLARSFMHRSLWLNDPDCLMLRQTETALSPEAMRTWARAVGVSGGMALVSDDLTTLDADARRMLDEVVALGRASDAAAIAGSPARCDDLMAHEIPRRLDGGGHLLDAEPAIGASTMQPPLAF